MLKLKLHIKILGGEMEDKEKVVSLYNYIAEVRSEERRVGKEC